VVRTAVAALPDAFVRKRQPAAIVDTLRRLRKLEPERAWRGPTISRTSIWLNSSPALTKVRPGDFFEYGRCAYEHKHRFWRGDEHAGRWAVAVALRGLEPETPGEPSAARLDEICRALVAAIDSNEVPKFPKIWAANRRRRLPRSQLAERSADRQ